MGNDDMDFTPEQVERQIEMLMQSQARHNKPSPDMCLISELYQSYTEDDTTVENAWQRLATQLHSASPGLAAGNAIHRSHTNMPFERKKRPQSMESNPTEKRSRNKRFRLLEICAAILLIGTLIAGMVILINANHQTSRLGTGGDVTATPGPTQTPVATETPSGTVLFSDPLSQNTNGWSTGSQYVFKNNAYHLKNEGTNSLAAICPHQSFTETSLTYQLTMEEITGDETSPNNTFGIIFDYQKKTSQNKVESESFYTFEILDEGASSQYAFYKYDDSRNAASPWTMLSHINAGNEFHSGHGTQATNVISVATSGSSFTFSVNGKQVGKSSDSSFQGGSVGMVVNLEGTEIAFSNLSVTHP